MEIDSEVKAHLKKYSENKPSRGLPIELVSGKPFYPTNPSSEDVDIRDIAHSLSLINRYGGHTRKPYSVAQHSWYISHLVSNSSAIYGLMHDTPEYVLGDIVRPLKHDWPQYEGYENEVAKKICEKFNIFPSSWPMEILNHDIKICYTERRDLMNHTGETDWGSPIEPHSIKLRFWSWRKARRKFLLRFYELTGDGLLKRAFKVFRDEIGYILNKRF